MDGQWKDRGEVDRKDGKEGQIVYPGGVRVRERETDCYFLGDRGKGERVSLNRTDMETGINSILMIRGVTIEGRGEAP